MKTIIRTTTMVVAIALASSELVAQSGPYQYFTLTPCRVVDTRNAVSTNGGPVLGTTPRSFQMRGICGIPLTAKAISANVTVVYPTAWSWLTIWPSGQAMPNVASINFDQNSTAIGNGALLGLSANTLDLTVANANGTCHVVIDVTGYYQ